MPTSNNLLALTAILALITLPTSTLAANKKNLRKNNANNQNRKLRRGQIDHVDTATKNKEEGLEEDVVFWTDMARRMEVMSITPNPTRRPTPDPTRRPSRILPLPPTLTPPTPTPPPPTPTPPTPTPPAFNCPPASFVGCTATDPSNPEDECDTIGEPCPDGLMGEFCCRDACPRNYCTAKEALPGTRE